MSHEHRLEYLRKQIETESISYEELAELQDLGARGLIPQGDTVLREWAGIPEFTVGQEEDDDLSKHT
jgi:hypothetical protein